VASAFDTHFETVVAPGLLAFHGMTVTHWPRGYDGSAAEVTAVWEPDETPALTRGEGGDETAYSGTLHVLTSVEVHREDRWVIDDVTYTTQLVGKPVGGMRTLTLQSVERIQTGRRNRERTL
jgi:hypothetical protein